MEIRINEINVSYLCLGSKEPLIMLHGWGSKKETFLNIATKLQDEYAVYLIDLPGFGATNISNVSSFMDYVNLLRAFILKLGISNPIILGHSFGGRMAIKYASLYQIKKLILVSTPGIRLNPLIVKTKVLIYKILKIFKIKNRLGSSDYKTADTKLRHVLIDTVNYNLKKALSQIRALTLIIHGYLDETVNYRVAFKMNKLISGSKLALFKNAKHFPYLEKENYFMITLKGFLNE